MRLDDLRHRTPESRTPRVLVLLGAIGLVAALWRGVIAARLEVKVVVAAAGVAIAWAVWRFARARR